MWIIILLLLALLLALLLPPPRPSPPASSLPSASASLTHPSRSTPLCLLSRYQAHPGVLRRKREAETSRKHEHERSGRACYWTERTRIPNGVTHRSASLDELVDAGTTTALLTTDRPPANCPHPAPLTLSRLLFPTYPYHNSPLPLPPPSGCSWELAHELMRFPILRLLHYSVSQVEGIPILEFLHYSIDRRMPEQQVIAPS